MALRSLLLGLLLFLPATALAEEPPPPKAVAQEPPAPAPAPDPAWKKDLDAAKAEAKEATNSAKADTQKSADIAWVLVATALVMVMMPGLALFYGGMVRRKNVLGTMMHTMAVLGIVGVQWVVCGYSLAFGETQNGYIGWSPELCLLGTPAAVGTPDKPDAVLKAKGLDPEKATDEQKKAAAAEIDAKNKFRTFPNTNVPLYLHAMFQGMFAIITVALISGAFAERVKFSAFCLFALLWTTLVYDPLAHWVWSFQWTREDATKPFAAAGWLGVEGALDFAGGTVVHIAAGMSGLVAVLLLRRRIGYGKQTFHPNNMVLTLLGAGLLWFGWFGFNGGSALASNALAVSALTVTQAAAAAAGVTWLLVEWLHRGKPTALGFASGVVAGLVAITPASGFVSPTSALLIGGLAGVVCYWAVAAKALLGYDDSLDAFGIHGIGGILGAILTGALVSLPLWMYGAGTTDPTTFGGKLLEGSATPGIDYPAQIKVQAIAVGAAAVYAVVVTAVLVLLIKFTIGFTLKDADEAAGLDLSQHGETGVDVGPDVDGAAVVTTLTPRAATAPPPQTNGDSKRFSVVVDGVPPKELHAAWAALCQVGETPPPPEFTALYKYVTTVSGNKFRFRGGDPTKVRMAMQKLMEKALPDTPVETHVEH